MNIAALHPDCIAAAIAAHESARERALNNLRTAQTPADIEAAWFWIYSSTQEIVRWKQRAQEAHDERP